MDAPLDRAVQHTEEYISLLDALKARIVRAIAQNYTENTKARIELNRFIGRVITHKQAQSGWDSSVVDLIAADLRESFPQPEPAGFSSDNVRWMCRFYRTYSSGRISPDLLNSVQWSRHILLLMYCKTDDEREFYLKMIVRRDWGFTVLERYLGGDLYEQWLYGQTDIEKPLV